MNGLTTRGLRMATGALALACLAACGGGGGGGGNNKDADASASATTTATVSGVASKGLMKNAIVKAFKLEANGSVGAQLGKTVRTDAKGHYSIVDLPAGITLLIEVSVDEGTRMADEATGTELTPPAGFKLRAAKVLSGGGAHLVQVTPFSEMAVATAVANGGLTADLVEAANQKVVSFANYAVLSTEPTFDASNKPTNPAAVTLAAVSQLAKNGDLLACKTKTVPAEKVACVVAELSARGASDEAIAASLEAAKQLAKAGYLGAVVPPVVKQPVQLATSGVKDAIAEAKTLIRNVRSNADASVADAMRERVRLVTEQVKANVSPLDDTNQFLVLGVAKAVAVLSDPQRELGTFTSADFTGRLGVGHETACTLFSDTQASVKATSLADVKAVKCSVLEDKAYDGPAPEYSFNANNTWTYAYHETLFTHEVEVSKGSASDQFLVRTSLIQVPTIHAYTTTWVGQQYYQTQSSTPFGAKTALSLPMTASASVGRLSNGHINAIALKGDLAPGVGLRSPLQDKLQVDLALSTQAISDVLTRLNMQGSFKGIKAGQASGTVAVLSGSYVQIQTKTPGDAFAGLSGDLAGASVHLQIEGVLSQGAKLTGVLDISEFLSSEQRTGPKTAVFKGALKQSNGEPLFDGEFHINAPVDPVLTSNHVTTVYAGWDATVIGHLPLPSRPDIVVNLAVTEPSVSVYNFAGSYEQGQDKVLISGLLNERKTSDEWLTLSTPSGLTVTARHGQQTYQIKKDSALIGEFYESSGKIIYADNSYEQF